MCYDASLQYVSEVGVNAYVKVRMSFLSQMVSSAIRYRGTVSYVLRCQLAVRVRGGRECLC